MGGQLRSVGVWCLHNSKPLYSTLGCIVTTQSTDVKFRHAIYAGASVDPIEKLLSFESPRNEVLVPRQESVMYVACVPTNPFNLMS